MPAHPNPAVNLESLAPQRPRPFAITCGRKTLGDREDIAQSSEQTGPISADIRQVTEPEPSCFGRFLKASRREQAICKLIEGFAHQLPIAEFDVDLERFTQDCNHRLPLAKTSLGNRQAGEQVSSFSQVAGIQMQQGGPQIGPRFVICCGLQRGRSRPRQPKEQLVALGERSSLEEMIGDFSGGLVNGIRSIRAIAWATTA
jgi:hypothetical protein